MALRDDLLAPLAGANPSGANLRYDPVTDTIKEARREDLDLAQGDWKTAIKTADYGQVIKLASDVLAKRSKDLQIAVWLVDAHIRRDGFSVLAPSFEFLRNLLDQFWDTLYPEVEDDDVEMRAAPLDWLGTKLEQPLVLLPITSSGLSFAAYKQSRSVGYEQDASTPERQAAREQAIKEGKATAEEYDEAVELTPRAFYDALQASLTAALEQLQSLGEFCDEKFADYSPSFLKTKTAIETIANQVRIFLTKKGPPPVGASVAAPIAVAPPAALTPATQPSATTVYAPPVTVQQVAAPQPPVASSAAVAPSNLDEAIALTGLVCKFLRDKTTQQAAAFLTIRALRWSELRTYAPDINIDKLQAPPAELRTELKSNFNNGNWDLVLEGTEKAMELPCGRSWLDLQRYTVVALENTGLDLVAASVRLALRTLLEELPALVDQSFTDDTPLANADTRAWLKAQVTTGQSPATAIATQAATKDSEESSPSTFTLDEDSRPPDLDSPAESAPQDVFEQALVAAQSSRPQEALELISKQLASEQSGRGRFRRRTQLAHLLIVAGHKQIAIPILQQLSDEIEQRRLEDWELGQAIAYPVELLLGCMDENGSETQDRKALYTRLCRLDPVRALKSVVP